MAVVNNPSSGHRPQGNEETRAFGFSVVSLAASTVFAGQAGRCFVLLNERQKYYFTDTKMRKLRLRKVKLPKGHKAAK